jgi:phage major head subunit gpT-like protein
MSILTRAQFAKQLVPGLNAIFGTAYKSIDNEHAPLFDIERSDRSFEEEVLMTGFGTAPVKSEGDQVFFDTASEAWTSRYTHETVAMAFAITEEAIEDNLYGTTGKMKANAMGRAMANAKQVKAANIYNNGFNTNALYAGGDGKPLFASDHPTLAAGTQSNKVSSDLSETALEAALINISLTKDDRGLLIGARAVSLHIPPQLQFVAHRILFSDLRVGTADNDTNAMKDMGLFSKGYTVNHRFTASYNGWP